MACGNASNQNQVSLPLHCNAYPALFNVKDGSIYFLPRLLPRNESFPIQDLNSLNPQILRNDYSMIRYPCLVTHHLPERDSYPLTNHLSESASNNAKNSNLLLYPLFPNGNRKIQDFHLPTNPHFTNRSNLIQDSHLINTQLSLNGVQMTKSFPPGADQVSTNELNISRQSYSQALQLPSNGIGMNQNSNMFIQQPSRTVRSVSQINHSPTHVLSQIEPRRSQVMCLLPHQQSARETTRRQGLQSIFQCHSNDIVGMVQNPYMSSPQTIVNEGSYSSYNFPEIKYNMNWDLISMHHDLPISNTRLYPNLYPQYSENVHICVVGPPGCGKANLIRTFARDDNILIPTGKPFKKVFQQRMVSFGTNLIIDIWHADNLTLAANDLKSHCDSSKSVALLVYSEAQRTTLLTVLEWIKVLKCDTVTDVPIILIENNTDGEYSSDSKEFSGIRVQEKYELEAFYQCLTECVEDIEAIFLFAAYKAFHRKIPSWNVKFQHSSDVF